MQDVYLPETTAYFIQVWNNDASGRNTDINEFEITLLDATLSNDNFDLENLKVFPNPVSDILHVENNGNINLMLEVFSSLGQKIMSSSINKIDISTLSSGIYFLHVISDENRVIRKIIKE